MRVEVYTKNWCPYSMRALRLLQTKGAEVEEYEISADGPKREEMIQRANGRTTVPQIFIDGRHIGGCDDLMRLEYDGELDALLGSEPA